MNSGEIVLHSQQSVLRYAIGSFIAIVSVALALGFLFDQSTDLTLISLRLPASGI